MSPQSKSGGYGTMQKSGYEESQLSDNSTGSGIEHPNLWAHG
jgi:hypothetical protein